MGQHWQRNKPLTRFWIRVNKADACWEWQGPLKRGYGSFYYDHHQGTAHRFSWELHRGQIPAGLQVCHTCDNPKCVRPDHLFLGTCKDNIQDCHRKGRHPRINRTHCLLGHALTTENVYQYVRRGYTCRACRICSRRREAKRIRRKVA